MRRPQEALKFAASLLNLGAQGPLVAVLGHEKKVLIQRVEPVTGAFTEAHHMTHPHVSNPQLPAKKWNSKSSWNTFWTNALNILQRRPSAQITSLLFNRPAYVQGKMRMRLDHAKPCPFTSNTQPGIHQANQKAVTHKRWESNLCFLSPGFMKVVCNLQEETGGSNLCDKNMFIDAYCRILHTFFKLSQRRHSHIELAIYVGGLEWWCKLQWLGLPLNGRRLLLWISSPHFSCITVGAGSPARNKRKCCHSLGNRLKYLSLSTNQVPFSQQKEQRPKAEKVDRNHNNTVWCLIWPRKILFSWMHLLGSWHHKCNKWKTCLTSFLHAFIFFSKNQAGKRG